MNAFFPLLILIVSLLLNDLKEEKKKERETLVGARPRIVGQGERGVGAEADGVSAEARIFLMGPR